MLFRPSLTRGYFDEMKTEGEALCLSGWMLNPRHPHEQVEARVGDKVLITEAPTVREDVLRAMPWIPHAARSGFRFSLPGLQSGDRLELRALAGRGVVARMGTTVRTDLDTALLSPPLNLMRRVAGTGGANFFKTDGLRCYTDFVDAAARHRPLGSMKRMLDWGCGCGRIGAYFLGGVTGPEYHGSDIDGEAIAWCQQNLTGGSFTTIDPYPPTPYPDAHFDLVIAYSVFTHLQRETQKLWLAEMRRVIAPGGLFLASVHGRFAACFRFPPNSWRSLLERARFLRAGFSDSTEDHALDGIAPDGYYRGVYQTRAYTLREWAPYFEMLELVEGGMASYQDLVVMRRRPD